MNPERTHRYVLEHVTGVMRAKTEMNRILIYGFAAAGAGAITVLAADGTASSQAVSLAAGLLLAGIPIGPLLQRQSLRIAISRNSLRLRRFMIGRKGYVAPKDHVMHEHADLFAAACNLVCHEPFLAPSGSAAAWHTFEPVVGLPGVAACIGWFGDSAQPTIFLYGDLAGLLGVSSDIWDLGHVRKFTALDKRTYTDTAVGWKRQQLIPAALARAPMPAHADPHRLTSQDINGNVMLLGAVGLEGSRGLGASFPISPTGALRAGTMNSLAVTTALAATVSLSAICQWLFGIPPFLTASHILIFKFVIEPLLVIAFNWDRAMKHIPKPAGMAGGAAWGGGIIGVLSLGSYLLYGYLDKGLAFETGSLSHRSAAAVAVLSLGFCLLLRIVLERRGRSQLQDHNPLFALAWASGLLLVLLLAYLTGPVLLSGLSLAVGVIAGYGLMNELQSYAERHHSREHILELLKTG